MSPLSADERAALHRLIDASRRGAIDWDADLRCVGCGVEQVDPDTNARRYVGGCRTCADRRSAQRRRE